MKARYLIEKMNDNGEVISTIVFTREIKDVKELDKEILKMASETAQSITVKEYTYYPFTKIRKDLIRYKELNKAKFFREFKEKYKYPEMHINSYRRVLYGQSTYLGKGHSPYIADMFRFFGKKLHLSFLDVAYDLLDSEYFGRKNTLLDVLVAESNKTKDECKKRLKTKVDDLEKIRLCDLNEDNYKFYNECLAKLKV